MSTLNIIIVVGIVVLALIGAIWFTISKFQNIESGETGRRKHIEEDMEVKGEETQK